MSGTETQCGEPATKILISPTTILTGVLLALAILLAVWWCLRFPTAFWKVALVFLLGGIVSHFVNVILVRLSSPLHSALTDRPASWSSDTASVFLEAAFPEELAKFVVLLPFLACFRLHQHLAGVVVTSVAVALGFAAIENAVFSLLTSGPAELALVRFFATASHGTNGVIMGYFLGAALRFRPWHRRSLVLSLFAPIMLHGIYDLLVARMEHLDLPADVPGEPTWQEAKTLLVALGYLIVSLSAWLGELGWCCWLLYRVRGNASKE